MKKIKQQVRKQDTHKIKQNNNSLFLMEKIFYFKNRYNIANIGAKKQSVETHEITQ